MIKLLYQLNRLFNFISPIEFHVISPVNINEYIEDQLVKKVHAHTIDILWLKFLASHQEEAQVILKDAQTKTTVRQIVKWDKEKERQIIKLYGDLVIQTETSTVDQLRNLIINNP